MLNFLGNGTIKTTNEIRRYTPTGIIPFMINNAVASAAQN
jgi:hypothetical protein